MDFLYRKCLPALTAGLLSGSAALAQQAATISSTDSADGSLQPVEVRSVRASDNSPFAKTNVSAAAIEKINLGQDLPFLLQYTPSAVVTSDAGAGVGYTGLRIRGTDGTRINVTLNGVPVNDGESAGTFFVNMPDLASSASSIQIQRGVGTSTNGPAAFGGTLSVSTLDGLAQPGAEVSASYGSFNTQKYTVKAGTGLLQNGFSADVRLSQLSSDGYMERSASMLRAAQLVAGWKISDRTSLRLLLLAGGEKTGQAWNGVLQDSLAAHRRMNGLGLKSNGSYYNNQTDNYRQNYYQLFADHRFSSRLSAHLGLFLTRGIGYYEEYRLGDDYRDYGLAPLNTPAGDTFTSTDLIRRLWLDNYNYGAVYSLLYKTEKGTTLNLGGGLSQFRNHHYGNVIWSQMGGFEDNYRWYNLHSVKNDFNIYAKAEHKTGSGLILFGDLQFRRIDYTTDGFRKNPGVNVDVNYNFFNPKAGLSYLLRNSAGGRQKVYASVAVANKEPNRDDFEASPTDRPKPERLLDFEGGYEAGTQRWMFSANAYYMRYKDQLVLTGRINDVGAYARTNVPESYRAGIELQAGWKPLSWLQLSGNATLSQNKILDFVEYVDTADYSTQVRTELGTTDLSFSPNVIAAAAVVFTPFPGSRYGKGFEIELAGKHVGKQYLDNSSSDARSIRSYTLADLRIRYAVQVRPFRELAFTLSQNNLFNRYYESNGYTFGYVAGSTRYNYNYYFPQAGYNWLLGLTVKW